MIEREHPIKKVKYQIRVYACWQRQWNDTYNYTFASYILANEVKQQHRWEAYLLFCSTAAHLHLVS